MYHERVHDLRLLIAILQAQKLATPQQLTECLRVPAAQRGRLLEVLVERGYLTEAGADDVRRRAAAMKPKPVLVSVPAPPPEKPPAPAPAPAPVAAEPAWPKAVEQRRQINEALEETPQLTPLEIESPPGVDSARAAYRRDHTDDDEAKAGVERGAPPPADSGPTIPLSDDRAPLAPPPIAISPTTPAPLAPPPIAISPTAPAPLAPPFAAPPPKIERAIPAAEAGPLHRLLRLAVERSASDVHFHAGLPPLWRVAGRLHPMPGERALTPAETEAMAMAALEPAERRTFVDTNDLDFSFTLPGVARFRSNAYRQQRGIDLVFRVVPLEIPTLRALGLPDFIAKFTTFHQGLILCTGPAGCGKSTTMAALIDLVNRDRADHILTIEDPIEFVHRPVKCLVRQRQVGRHTESFARALKAALREDPDVIVVGELRDLETVQLALSAAETGHLVMATLHTNNAVRTINRVLNVFPPEQQSQVRVMFASSLRAIISQRLVPRADGAGRVPAIEVLTATPAVVNLIRDEKQHQLRSAMQTGRAHGMRLLEDSLRELVASGVITAEAARLGGDNPETAPVK